MTGPVPFRGLRLLREEGWHLLATFAFALVLHGLAAWPIRQPGYMDACYYYNGAVALYEGQGFTDAYLWNYLDDPSGIPHPSHLYWMPLPSVLTYLSFLLLGPRLRAAQVVGVVLSALLAPLAYVLSRASKGQRWQAVLAAGLVAFSGFYLVYWPAPDSFAPFGLVGSLCLLALGWGVTRRSLGAFALAGALAGLAHLSRADGLLLAVLAAVLPWWTFRRAGREEVNHEDTRTRRNPKNFVSWCLCGEVFSAGLREDNGEERDGATRARVPKLGGGALAGAVVALLAYGAVMAPWLARNLHVLGQPFPATGLMTLFLRDYDDLFGYGREISLSTYLAWGWGNILTHKAAALWANSQTVVAVWLQVFGAPFAVVGLWRLRRNAWFQVAALYGALLYLSMSLGFSEPGQRGALFHSGAATLPFLYAAVGPGLEGVVLWAHRWRRHWQPEVACRVFAAGFLALSALLSGMVYARNVWGVGPEPQSEPWNRRDALYPQVEAWLASHASPEDRILVVNPPCFYTFSQRPCLAIPNEPLPVVLEAADRYGARFLLLERNHPRPLDALYAGAEGHPRLQPVARWEGATLFAIGGGP
ncbi:MAG: hypothetical protein ACUVXG_01110 [Anaerolineae bacterium]